MKLRTIIFTLITIVAMTASAAGNGDLVAQGNKAYNAKDYKKALTLYERAARDGVSTQLYYNMGNTHYRLNDVAGAILCYERALKIDPSNGDARYNLDFIREKSQLNPDTGATFFSSLLGNTISRVTSNQWAVIAVITLLLMLAAITAFKVSSSILMQKGGFFGALAMLVLTVLAIACSVYVYNRCNSNTAAIVMTDKSAVVKSPHQEKAKTEFSLRRGVRVEVTDSVKAKAQQKAMYKIETDDDRTGWVAKSDIEKI